MSYINSKNFITATRYIYDHIDQPIQLDELAREVGISLSSLKRLFIDTSNQTPGAFIRRMRMELAFRSLRNRTDSVLEVAMSAGFDDQSAFARRFKETFGYSPSVARKKLNIVNELDCVFLDEPEILELKDFHIQSVTEKGLYYESAPKAWHTLIGKLTPAELDDDFSAVFIGISHDNPHDGLVAEDQVRYTAGVTLIERDLGFEHVTVPGGRYARFCYTGKPVNLGLAYHYIYGNWLEVSKFEINPHIPAFVAFDALPEGLKEHKLFIHIPIME